MLIKVEGNCCHVPVKSENIKPQRNAKTRPVSHTNQEHNWGRQRMALTTSNASSVSVTLFEF